MTDFLIASSSSEEECSSRSTSSQEKPLVKKLLQSPSGSGIQSVLSLDSTNDTFFRICEYCFKLLDMRQRLKEVRNQKPIICQFYEKMKASIDEVDSQLPIYQKMFKSLSVGETTFNLIDAELVRVKILKAAENIDLLSNKIAVLGQNSEDPPNENQLLLQKAVRNAAKFYLKENIVSLPSLPKEDQIKKAQEQRRLEIARRIEEESRLESFENIQNETKSNKQSNFMTPTKVQPSSQPSVKEVIVEDGWTPEVSQAAASIISDHPIIQQINIIKGYIKQAELANRREEVNMLQKNLRDLEEEFWKQTKECYVESMSK